MKRLHLIRILLLAMLVLTLGQIGFSQTAQVTGRISDSSGAVVPGAQVTVTNQKTGLTRDSISNGEGYFTIPLLPPGDYRLTVKKEGFKPVVRPDVALNVEQVARLDFTLEAGAVSETVTITSDAPLMNTETSSVGQVVDNKTVVTLPLNGRNYSQLAVLAPGATPNPGSRTEDGFSLNGNRLFQNSYQVDGADNNNYIFGVDTNTTQALRPSVDAIQEFKVETANYSAEYGRAAGGVISVAIKSGANQLHGSAFEFLRNDALDAANFFANRNRLSKPPLRYNQFGGAIGGPVWKNHTFFFFSYQGTRIRTSDTAVVTVPTPDMKRGVFGSTNIFDPANVVSGARVQFANNTIPASRIDPVGAKLVALYPDPNQPGAVNNYASIQRQTDDADQFDVRGDHSFSGNDKIFARFSRSDRGRIRSPIFAAPGNGGAFATQPLNQIPKAWSVAGGYTRVISAAAVNELRINYTQNDSDQLALAEKSLYADFGIKGVPDFEGLVGLPTINVTNFTGLGDRTFTPNPKQAKMFQIRNFHPDRPYFQCLDYLEEMPTMKEWRRLYKDQMNALDSNYGKALNPTQLLFMQPQKPPEELYDVKADTHEIHNLANDPQHQATLKQMRAALDKWQKETNAQFQKFVEATGYKTIAEREPDPKDFPDVPKEKLVAGSAVFTPPFTEVSRDNFLNWWKYVPGANWKRPEGPQSDLKWREDHPAIQIAWEDAMAYAKWAGKRLPTEAEFEFAARGGLDRNRYAWGDELKPNGKWAANIWQGRFPWKNGKEDGYERTSPVRAFPPNGFGLYDMGGNVWQWCADWYRPDYFAELAKQGVVKNPQGPTDSFDPQEPGIPKRVQKSGSFLCSDQYCSRYLVGSRDKGAPDSGGSNTGFRCIRPVS